MKKRILCILLLSVSWITARAETKHNLYDDPILVAQSKKVVFVYLVLDDDKIVVRDSNNCLWKLVFLKHYPGAYGNGYNHQPMILEATVTKGITASDHSEVYHVEYRI